MYAATLANHVPRIVALVLGGAFAALGAWAMVDPASFFASLATFEPYNQHFLQDIGAFQIGLGAVLLLAAAMPGADVLVAALLGTGLGAALHFVSHVIGVNLGGNPATDIPVFGALAILLLATAAVRWRSIR